jgi:hypothetical protein
LAALPDESKGPEEWRGEEGRGKERRGEERKGEEKARGLEVEVEKLS